jgi:hypothetical protein
MTLWRKVAEMFITAFMLFVSAVTILAAFLFEERAAPRFLMLGTVLFLAGILKLCAVSLLRRRDGLFAQAANDASATLRLSRPKPDRLAIVVCGWLAAAGSVLLSLGSSELLPAAAAFFLAALFGGMAAFATFKLRSPVTLRLSPQGLDYSVFKTGPIAWPDILAVNPASVGRVKVIALKLADETKYLPPSGRLPGSWGNRFFLSTHFAFQSRAFGVSSKLIMRAINTRLSAFGRTESSLLAKTA